MNETTLKEIHKQINEYLYLEDNNIIDLLLATMLTRKQTQSKIWLIIISKSGDGKTALLNLLQTNDTIIMKKITPNTLVNGRKNKKAYPDLAPTLKNKIILMPEMAQIISLYPEAMKEVWAQLRDLYDGVAGKQSGDGTNIYYENLNITFIGCSTPAYDAKALINQNLGTRELIYRPKDKNETKLIQRITENTEKNTQPVPIIPPEPPKKRFTLKTK